MICRRCKTPMVRFVNERQTAHTVCARCNNFVECAVCPKCRNTVCVKCYNKPPPKATGDPLIPSGSIF